jgi:hypothetical protein
LKKAGLSNIEELRKVVSLTESSPLDWKGQWKMEEGDDDGG